MEHEGKNLRDDNAGPGGDDAFESLLARALRIDVPAAGSPVATRRPRRWLSIAVAASVLIAVGVTVNNFYDARYFSSDDLATDVVAHMNHEPGSLRRTESVVATGEFDQVLQQAGARLSVAPPAVSYVRLCPFRGHMVAHFVVQASHGPVTVLLLPDERVDTRVAVDEDGFIGTIVPMQDGGSIAVVGKADEDISEVRDQIANALRWRL